MGFVYTFVLFPTFSGAHLYLRRDRVTDARPVQGKYARSYYIEDRASERKTMEHRTGKTGRQQGRFDGCDRRKFIQSSFGWYNGLIAGFKKGMCCRSVR